MSLAVDIKDRLVTDGIGTFAATSGWGIYISREPTTPDTSITIYETGSVTEPSPKFKLDFNTFQIRVRGARNGYAAAEAKTAAIKAALLGLGGVTLNSTKYVGIWMVTDILFLKYDEGERPIFVTNWRVAREPSSSDNRTAL